MVMRKSFQGVVRGLPKGVKPTTTVSAPSECYPYIEQISYSYTQPDITEPGYWLLTVDIEQDTEAESGSQWGPFTLTITSPGCQGVNFVADASERFDVFLKKYTTVSQLSDGTNIYWVKDIDAREMLETKADSSDIPTAISDLTDDTNTTPIDKAKSVVDQNNTTNALKYWTGTKAQYDAIVTKDNNTIYNVDDSSTFVVDILNSLYPIGAIYIGTMATCPLSVLGVGTWQLVAQDRVLQGAGTRGAVGTTINESLPNITGSLDATCSGANGNLPTRVGCMNATGTGIMLNAGTSSAYINNATISVDASRSSSTYQDDAPVQQNGYLVNIWERIS